MKVKLKNNLCPKYMWHDPSKQFGRLNYWTIFLNVEFEVIGTFRDSYRGEMVSVKVPSHPPFNPKYGALHFIKDDCEFLP